MNPGKKAHPNGWVLKEALSVVEEVKIAKRTHSQIINTF